MATVTRQTIDLSSLANTVADTEAPGCDATICRDVIVVRSARGSLDLIDGFHRVAGLFAGGQTVASVIVIDGDLDDELAETVGRAADPSDRMDLHEAAIAAIVEMAQ